MKKDTKSKTGASRRRFLTRAAAAAGAAALATPNIAHAQ